MVITTITVFSTTWAGRGEVFSHHLPRGHPRRLDDEESCCISRRFSYRYYAKQKCEYCDKARTDRNCRQTPTVFLATDFHIAHDPNMHDVLVYYFGTSGSAAHAYGTFKLVNILSFLNFLTSLSSVRSGISNLCHRLKTTQVIPLFTGAGAGAGFMQGLLAGGGASTNIGFGVALFVCFSEI
jgi:hypothetical protein